MSQTSPGRNDAPLDLSFLDTAVHPGDLGQLGAYRILALLGQGGMGIVLKAIDPALERQVAVKVMRPELAADPLHRERFLREARAMAAVQYDGIIAIHQVGEHGGLPFLAMPLLVGESLEARLRRVGSLPYREVLRVGRETAAALAAAHDHGLIHRDIKPDNLWLDAAQDKVRILDFGLARPLEGDLGATSPGGVVGTAHYMAPEQARGEPLDTRADLFSLGCTLYRMSTGRLPFPGDNLFAIFTNLATPEPPPPHKWNAELPHAFSALVLRLLNKDRERRTLSAQELSAALTRLENPDASPAPWPQRRRWPLLAGGLALLLVGGLWIRPRGDPISSPTTLADSVAPNVSLEVPDGPLFTLPECYSAAFGPGDRYIVTCGAWTHPPFTPAGIAVYEAASGKRLARMGHGTTDGWQAMFSPDGTRIYQVGRVGFGFSAAGFVHVWDWNGEALAFNRSLDFNYWRGEALAVSADGQHLAAGGVSTTGVVWRTRFLREAFRFEHLDRVQSLAFSPDGTRLASAGRDGSVRIWEAEGKEPGRRVAVLNEPGNDLRALLWSRDGTKLFIGGSEHQIRCWEVIRAASSSTVFAATPRGVRSLTISPNGRYLVSGDDLVKGGDWRSGGDDDFGKVRFWSLETGQQVASFAAHLKGQVQSLTFSSDGTRLLTSGPAECYGKVWQTPQWLRTAPERSATP